MAREHSKFIDWASQKFGIENKTLEEEILERSAYEFKNEKQHTSESLRKFEQAYWDFHCNKIGKKFIIEEPDLTPE